jgi:hypothetical protein
MPTLYLIGGCNVVDQGNGFMRVLLKIAAFIGCLSLLMTPAMAAQDGKKGKPKEGETITQQERAEDVKTREKSNAEKSQGDTHKSDAAREAQEKKDEKEKKAKKEKDEKEKLAKEKSDKEKKASKEKKAKKEKKTKKKK